MSGKMFTGYNTNVKRDGKVFHVQTEDKGIDNPIVETVVFSGGQVIASVQNSYADLAESPDYSQDRIRNRMRQQHQSLLEDLHQGELQSTPAVRYKIEAPDLSHDNLVHECVEDWIDRVATNEAVHGRLERRIDQVQAAVRQRRSRSQKKKSTWIVLIVALLGVGAAFEFGRLSQSVEPAEPLDPVPSRPAPELPIPAAVELEQLPELPAAPAIAPAELEPTIDPVRPAPEIVTPPVIVERSVTPVLPAQPVVVESVPQLEPPEARIEAVDAVETVDIVTETPVQAPPVDRIYEAGEVDEAPTSIATQLPVYTRTALSRSKQGAVRMNVLVGADGWIDAVRLTDGIADSKLNRAAISAVLHWQFNPGKHRGQPVRVWLPVRLDFKLSRDGLHSVVTISEH